ncbi:hypothetical protein BH09MYX1_BH09MYX1_09550 [soil metagenome]
MSPVTETAPWSELAAQYAAVLEHRAVGGASLRAALTAYIAQYPSSPNRADAFIALGDLELAAYDGNPAPLAEARSFYWNALGIAKGRTLLDAAYKLGRVDVLRGDYDEAIKAFKNAAAADADKSVESAILRDRALRDLAGAFAFTGTPNEAYPLFAQITLDEETIRMMLVELAQGYDRLGKDPERRSVYDELRRRDPKNGCQWTVRYRHAAPNADPATLEADLAKCR